MKDPVIHVGLPKTATSFFQSKVFPYFEGIQLVDTGSIQASAAFNHLQYADDSLYDPALMRQFIDALPDRRTLFSDEQLSGRFVGFGGVINRTIIAQRLRDLMPDARILLFLRGQPAYLYSAYQQYIKGYARGTKPFERFVHHPEGYENPTAHQHFYDGASIGFTPHYIFYYELIKLYTSLFPEVKIVLFEDFVHTPESVLAEIEDFIKPSNSLAGQIDWKARDNNSTSARTLHERRYHNSTRYTGSRVIAKIFRELLVTLNYRFKKVTDPDRISAQSMGRFFRHNNDLVIKHFPEIGIQRYPDDYPTTSS